MFSLGDTFTHACFAWSVVAVVNHIRRLLQYRDFLCNPQRLGYRHTSRIFYRQILYPPSHGSIHGLLRTCCLITPYTFLIRYLNKISRSVLRSSQNCCPLFIQLFNDRLNDPALPSIPAASAPQPSTVDNFSLHKHKSCVFQQPEVVSDFLGSSSCFCRSLLIFRTIHHQITRL